MPIQWRNPNSDYSVQWYGGPPNYVRIADYPGVNDDNYVYTYENLRIDKFGIFPFNIPSEAVFITVTMHIRAAVYDTIYPVTIYGRITIGGTDYEIAQMWEGEVITEKSMTWENNPSTGNPWTPAGVNSIAYIGYRSGSDVFPNTVIITSLYVIVEYWEPPSATSFFFGQNF